MRTLLHIGEIAQLLGVTPKTIRHYQKVGLLAEPERSEAGYRLYSAGDLLRLQRVRRLQALGLSLKQIRHVLGDAAQEHTLREVLQSLDGELERQIATLQERRDKIRTLLDEDGQALKAFDAPAANSPTLQYVQEHLGQQLAQISPELWEQEAQLYALLDNFHWSEGHDQAVKEMAQRFIQHYAEHPEEYQLIMALGERFAALATLPEDAPAVTQVAQDFIQYLESHPFLLELQQHYPQVENPLNQVFSELMLPIYSPAQRKVLNEIGRRYAPGDST